MREISSKNWLSHCMHNKDYYLLINKDTFKYFTPVVVYEKLKLNQKTEQED